MQQDIFVDLKDIRKSQQHITELHIIRDQLGMTMGNNVQGNKAS